MLLLLFFIIQWYKRGAAYQWYKRGAAYETSLNSALSRFKRLKNKCLLFLFDSTSTNGEVKEFKEVRAICFTDKYSTKKAVGYNF